MKKLLFICTTLFIFSCSSSDDGSKETSNGDFHPPEWILGKWSVSIGLPDAPSVVYSFTKNDFCMGSTLGTTTQCQQGLVDLMRKGDSSLKVVENISSTVYSVEIRLSTGQITTYTFKKVSNNSIEYNGAPGLLFTKQK